MMNESTLHYAWQHRTEDPRRLALGAKPADEVDMKMALQQIAGWQTARRKLPTWAATEGLWYPPHLNMEQCSSEQTARYKATLTQRWAGATAVYIDLTGGLGIDFAWASQGFARRVYVERHAELCELARHNFPLLDIEAEVVCGDAEEVLENADHATVVFLDPARRDEHGGRTYGMADCTPDVLKLLPMLRQKADHVVLKLSPMLDGVKAAEDLGGIEEMHIVSVDNECKELLLVLGAADSQTPRIVCVNGDQVFEPTAVSGAVESRSTDSATDDYLYEPNASIMKAGCFAPLAAAFGVRPIAANTHLFTAREAIAAFPGRSFRIDARCSMNKKELRDALAGISRANIAVRNFPMSADQLRKKLKMKDGGEHYIFGVTQADGSHQLLICRKIG